MQWQGNVVQCQLANNAHIFSDYFKRYHHLLVLPHSKLHCFCNFTALLVLCSSSFHPLACYLHSALTELVQP